MSIEVTNLCKCYQIYERPQDRLKQSLIPRLSRLVGKQAPTYYREFWALRDVSLQIAQGETVGIVGRNGSGKSTLLQIICGTLTPTAGTVDVRGRVSALLELGAGFNPEFSGRENVLVNAAILGFPREQMVARMDQVVAFSELGDFLDQPVKTYSSGMYARLAFSAAIHVDPDVLIVDETLAVGDARFVAKCMRRIREIKEAGTTILFVSHDVASVRALCDSAVWLDGGRVIDMGDVFPVTGRYMEFLFRDEADGATDLCGESSAGTEPLLPNGAETSAEAPAGGHSESHWGRVDATPGGKDAHSIALDSRPVTHWGSHRGLILSAAVRDKRGARRDVHRWAAEVEVLIEVRVPETIPRDQLSISFSIKDLKGTDLIVSTTRDITRVILPEEEHFAVSFRFVNPLVTGRYLLVAAVENRQDRDIHYYEYLEGAHYFSSLADQPFFGLFQPAITQYVSVG